MRKKIILLVGIILLLAIMVSLILYASFSGNKYMHLTQSGAWTHYHFDVKNLRFATTIEVHKEGDFIGTVKGDILHLITDPLSFYDTSDNRIAYASDAYHLISQDSHMILVNNQQTAEMIGQIKVFGEAYDIYASTEKSIFHADFNAFDTAGILTDGYLKPVAVYDSKLIFNDFEVYVSSDCSLDEPTLIMIFASYYSDKTADRNSSSSRSNDK